MRGHRHKVAQDSENAKKDRLQKRARLLTTEDLLAVVALREKVNFNAASLFGSAQNPDEGPSEGHASSGPYKSDAGDAGERVHSPVHNTGHGELCSSI